MIADGLMVGLGAETAVGAGIEVAGGNEGSSSTADERALGSTNWDVEYRDRGAAGSGV